MNINQLLSDINNGDLVMPEFQREYVWNREQAKQLMVSLFSGYPVGGLLFWKTDNPPALKNVSRLPEKMGTIQVILDGQQRLTTLFLLIEGKIPPYYSESEITNDVRNLYFNLLDKDFEYFQPLKMKNNPFWISVVDSFNDPTIDVFKISESNSPEGTDPFELAKKLNDNLNRLKNIRTTADLPVQIVPAESSLDQAIDVFDRVNSLGTKLTDAELALTHVIGKWPEARRVIKSKSEELSQLNFDFDLTFMTRALNVVVTNHALFPYLHDSPLTDVKEGWDKCSKILDYLVAILPSQAFVHSTEDLSTNNILIPLVMYLSQNENKFLSDQTLRRAIHWLYAAQIGTRYTGQTDTRLEHDVTIITREPSPWDSLLGQITDVRGRIDVKASDFEGREAQHPLYRMSFILAKAHQAIDWFNGVSLGTPVVGAYRLQSHHIFPQSVLYKNGFDSDNHLHRKTVNEIANRAFITGDTNLKISNRLPEEYLPEVEERYPGALVKHFVPMDPTLWKIDQYSNFLEARRQILASKLNEFMGALVNKVEPTGSRPISELIARGESINLEFKSTLQWDVVQESQNRTLRDSSLKTLVAFMNSEGGTLLIGVEDSGEVFGLHRDIALAQGSEDGFLQLLSSLILDRIGAQFVPLIRYRIEAVDEQPVCVIDVNKSSEPAFLDGQKGKEFYVRAGNTSRSLDPEQTMDYIETQFRGI